MYNVLQTGGQMPNEYLSGMPSEQQLGEMGMPQGQLSNFDFLNQPSDQMVTTQDPESYLSQIGPILQQYMGQYGQMLQDPTGTLANIGAGYLKSPGLDYETKAGEQAITQAASAGGMAGTPTHQGQAAQFAEDIAGKDYYDYIRNALGIYGMGATGQRGLGEDLSSSLMSQAQLGQTQREEQQRQKEFEEKQEAAKQKSMWDALGKMGGSALGMLRFA